MLSKPVGVPLVAFRLKKVVGSDGKEHGRCAHAGGAWQEGRRQGRGRPGLVPRSAAGTVRAGASWARAVAHMVAIQRPICTLPLACRLYDEFALADRLRMRGWVLPGGPVHSSGSRFTALTVLPSAHFFLPWMPSVPAAAAHAAHAAYAPFLHPAAPAAYKAPEGAEHVKMMRVTIREDFSLPMVDLVRVARCGWLADCGGGVWSGRTTA